jgi:hypothetical protein
VQRAVCGRWLISVKSFLENRFSTWWYRWMRLARAVTVVSSKYRSDVGKVDFGGCKWLYIVHIVVFTRILLAQDNVRIDVWIYQSTRAGAVIPTVSLYFPYDFRKFILIRWKEGCETPRGLFWKIDFRIWYTVGRGLRRWSTWRPRNFDWTPERSISWGISVSYTTLGWIRGVKFEK